jgi:hypothetical protein
VAFDSLGLEVMCMDFVDALEEMEKHKEILELQMYLNDINFEEVDYN